MKNYQYTTYEKDFSSAMFISPDKTALMQFDRPKEENFPNALYVWPFGCERFHAYRLFTPQRAIIKAEMAFLCDNLFDVWLNGKLVACDVKHLELKDVTEFLTEGENNLHIRGYQSASDETFSAAITGGIRLYYADGEKEEIVTDQQFRQVHLVDFWETEEPDGFETETVGRGTSDMNVMELHPIALRRSFYFIRRFHFEQKPVKALLYSSALGCYEPYMNGRRVTDSFFMPFCCNYQKEYQQFDLLPFLQEGDNTIGVVLGNGSYNCRSWGQLSANVPEFIGIIELVYEDGQKEYIYTDEKWLCMPSPLLDNDIQYGERYDARLEKPDWCWANVDVSTYMKVSARKNEEHPLLLEQNYPYIKKCREYRLEGYRLIGDNTPMYDLGVCIAGRARITFNHLPEGKKVRIRYCERLTEEGMPENGAYTTVHYQQDCAPDGRSNLFMRNMDVYTAKGTEEETYECRFAYTGFRYIWIELLDDVEQVKELVAFELHNDLADSGEIITSDETINKIFTATKRSWHNNLFNGPTDCPTREKNFWNGDTQIFSHAACWLSDTSSFFARWTDNGVKMHEGPYAYEDETYEMPLTLYRFYGDKEILRRRYPEMLRLVEKRTEYDGMLLPKVTGRQYCDWLSPTGISPDAQFFGACWYYHMLVSVAEVARILGEQGMCAELEERAAATREEFNKRHMTDDGWDYDPHNQCGIVLPLAFGIAPEECRQQMAATLVEYIKKADYHLTTGFIGTRYIFEVLADFGYADIAYKIICNKTFPSWLDMFSTGATAITESWMGEKDPDKSLSMAHFTLGSVVGWFFEYLGGIRVRDCGAGFSEIVLRPVLIKEIGNFSAKYMTKLGEVYTEWHFEGDKPVFNYHIPEGVSAKVILG